MPEVSARKIPVLTAEELRVRLRQPKKGGWTELYLFGPDWHRTDAYTYDNVSFFLGAAADLDCVFRLSSDCPMEDWSRLKQTLRQLACIRFRLKAAGLEYLQDLKQLTSLDLRDNALGPEGATAIAPALQQMDGLTSLNLGDNALGPEGASAIAPALRQMQGLTSLNLWDNALGPEGASAITPALRQMQGLTSLDLGWNKLGPEGATAIAPALRQMQGLTSLDLGNNALGPEGATAIAPALQQMEGLTSLNLGYNALGPEGATAIAPALRQMQGLTSLNLGNNALGPEGATAIAPALRQMEDLTSLDLGDNAIGDAGIRTLAEAKLFEQPPHRHVSIDLDHNDIHCVEQSLLRTRNAERIFRAVLEGAALPHARVMLVGMGRVGKSALFRRCFLDEIEPVQDHQPTDDIDMIRAEDCDWKPVLQYVQGNDDESTSQTIDPTIWDFGGQLILHGIHEAFLVDDERTIYLVVMDAKQVPEFGSSDKDGKTGSRLTYWLKTLRHFAGEKPPVVIVVTKCDEKEIDWKVKMPLDVRDAAGQPIVITEISQECLDRLRSGYHLNFSDVVQPFSARKEDLGLKKLRTAIETALKSLPPLKTKDSGQVNEEFKPLKEHVDRELPLKTLIKVDEFRQWCALPAVSVTDSQAQDTFLSQLHYLGSLSYFGRTRADQDLLKEGRIEHLPPGRLRWLLADRSGDLEDWIFNPNWLKHAAYSVLKRGLNEAWLSEDELFAAVEEGTKQFVGRDRESRVAHPENARQEMRSVKEFLKLSQLAWHHERRGFLLPRGLKSSLPESKNWDKTELRWDYLPEANFHRFIVRVHLQYLVVPVEGKEDEWHHGRLWALIDDPTRTDLKSQHQRTQVLVVADPAAGKIEVRFEPSGDASRWEGIVNELVRLFVKEIQMQPLINVPVVLSRVALNVVNTVANEQKESEKISKSTYEQNVPVQMDETVENVFGHSTMKLLQLSSIYKISLEKLRKEIIIGLDKDGRIAERLVLFYEIGLQYKRKRPAPVGSTVADRSLNWVQKQIADWYEKQRQIVRELKIPESSSLNTNRPFVMRQREKIESFFCKHFGFPDDETSRVFVRLGVWEEGTKDTRHTIDLTTLGWFAWRKTRQYLKSRGLLPKRYRIIG